MMIRFGSSQSSNALPAPESNPKPGSRKLKGPALATLAQLQLTAPNSSQTQVLQDTMDRFEKNAPSKGRGGDHTYRYVEEVGDNHSLMRAETVRQRLAKRLADRQAEQQKQEAMRKAGELMTQNLSAEELTQEMEKLGFSLLSNSAANPFALESAAPVEEKKESTEPVTAPKQKTQARIDAAKRKRKAQAARRKEKAATSNPTESSTQDS